ncbi:chorismate lyase, partial [Neisseria meningitidis]|nr:chorismate lyase [Neisseria meningitidis]
MGYGFEEWLPDLPAPVSDGIGLPMSRLLKARSLTAALRALPHTFSVELLKLGELETECGGRL